MTAAKLANLMTVMTGMRIGCNRDGQRRAGRVARRGRGGVGGMRDYGSGWYFDPAVQWWPEYFDGAPLSDKPMNFRFGPFPTELVALRIALHEALGELGEREREVQDLRGGMRETGSTDISLPVAADEQ